MRTFNCRSTFLYDLYVHKPPANMTRFNYLRPPPPLHPTPPISMISVQNYKICIRSEQGACYAEFRSDTNQFHLEPVGQPKKSGNSDNRFIFNNFFKCTVYENTDLRHWIVTNYVLHSSEFFHVDFMNNGKKLKRKNTTVTLLSQKIDSLPPFPCQLTQLWWLPLLPLT